MVPVDRDWKVLPDGTSSYVIFADAGREHINEGLIVAASETAVTLNAASSDIDGAYVGQRIFIRSGYGQDQMRRVASYDGSTHIATVEVAWDEIPDSTSAYVMLPTGAISNTEIGTAVWEHSGRSIDSIDLNIYETGYLIVGQGLGTTHYTNTISFGPNRNKEGFQVKAYKTTDGLTDFSVIVAMDITDSLGAFDLWLDPSYYVLRVEKNGASIDSAIILVE